MNLLALPEVAITRNSIHHMDLFQLCNAMGDQSVDMILCDLPYGTTACSWDSVIPMIPMWEQFKRIIKPKGAIVLTATEPFASHLRMSAIDIYKYDWLWVKTSPTDFIRAKLKPMNKHESVLVFSCASVANGVSDLMNYFPQGLTKVNKIQKNHYNSGGMGLCGGFGMGRNITPNNVLSLPEYTQEFEGYPNTVLQFESAKGTIHPTQKPTQLFEYLIKTYTRESDLVFDPCVGSGTTAVAAQNTGRDYICGDFTREYVEMARERVQNSDPFQATIDRKTGIKQMSLFEAY